MKKFIIILLLLFVLMYFLTNDNLFNAQINEYINSSYDIDETINRLRDEISIHEDALANQDDERAKQIIQEFIDALEKSIANFQAIKNRYYIVALKKIIRTF